MIQLTLTLKMTTAQVVETSVTVNDNSPIQDYVNPDDQTQPTFEMTPGFKPFTVPQLCHDYFTAVALLGSSVSGTVWSIGHLVHAHSKQMFDRYGTGLGINTMQGRD